MPPASHTAAIAASLQGHVCGAAVNVTVVVNEGRGGSLPRVNG